MTELIQHGRRAGETRSADGPRTEFLFNEGINGTAVDLRSVKILSRDDYNRIQRRLNRHQLEEERRKQIIEEKENLKNQSQEIVKNWTNTVMGARQRKLDERDRRLAEEEKEKQRLDFEEARLGAEMRREAIEKAKTQQYYQTDRVKGLHRALILTEVLKEREAQLELKRLKAQAEGGEDDRYLELAQKEYEESIQKDQANASKRINNAKETAEYLKAQIRRNLREKEKENEENAGEGENIHRLAVATALEKQRMEQIAREERRRNMQDNLRQISDVKRMQEIQRIQEAEEDEECRIFAAAKKKMMKLRVEKEREIHERKQENLDRIKKQLSDQLSALVNDEEDRMTRALDEQEAKEVAEDTEKAEKRAKEIAEIARHRHEQREKAEKEAKERKQQEMEMVRARKAADELFRKNQAEKNQRQFEKAKRVADYMLHQAEERQRLAENSREAELRYDAENEKLVADEEAQFQDYASKVIDHCKKGGRNTYALERAAKEGAGGGLGPQFPGKGGVRPSYLTSDKSGVELPHYRRAASEDIKTTIHGTESTAHRLGFVW